MVARHYVESLSFLQVGLYRDARFRYRYGLKDSLPAEHPGVQIMAQYSRVSGVDTKLPTSVKAPVAQEGGSIDSRIDWLCQERHYLE